jgi:hypothetical protein
VYMSLEERIHAFEEYGIAIKQMKKGPVDWYRSTRSRMQSILQSSKSSGGSSFETLFEIVCTEAGLQFDRKPALAGNPDFIFPNLAAYTNPEFPKENIHIVETKSTTKERWKEVLHTAANLDKNAHLYLLTGEDDRLSKNKKQQLSELNIIRLHTEDKSVTENDYKMINLDNFFNTIRTEQQSLISSR